MARLLSGLAVAPVFACPGAGWLAGLWPAERRLQGNDDEVGPAGPSPTTKSHDCFQIEHDARFHWDKYCTCMEECVAWTRFEGPYAEAYSSMLEVCVGGGFMEDEPLQTRVVELQVCPVDWVRCESSCLNCVGCNIKGYIPWCEKRLVYWAAFFKTCGDHMQLCQEVCQPGTTDVLLYIMIVITSASAVCMAVHQLRKAYGPQRPAALNILDAYDRYKDQRKIDDEDMMDKQIELMGNTADFYKVVNLAKQPDEFALSSNVLAAEEEMAEVVGVVDDPHHGNLTVSYPVNAPIADAWNRPEFKDADGERMLQPSQRITCQECGKWRFCPVAGKVHDRVITARDADDLISCELLGTVCSVPEHPHARKRDDDGKFMKHFEAFPEDTRSRMTSNAIRTAGLRPREPDVPASNLRRPLFAEENRRVEAAQRAELKRREDDKLRPAR